MKTLQELYNEIIANDGLKNAFVEAAKDNKVVEFAKEHGVDTTLDEIKAFLKEQTQADNKELTPEEMENAAGGTCNKRTDKERQFSIFTIGVGCAFEALISAVAKDRHVGQEKDADGRLCNRND